MAKHRRLNVHRLYRPLMAGAAAVFVTFRGDPGFRPHRFPPEEVNEALLERLTKVLLRKEKQLVEVSVSAEVRSDLRRQLEAEQQLKVQLLAEANAAREADRDAQLIYRVKRWVAAVTRSLFTK